MRRRVGVGEHAFAFPEVQLFCNIIIVFVVEIFVNQAVIKKWKRLELFFSVLIPYKCSESALLNWRGVSIPWNRFLLIRGELFRNGSIFLLTQPRHKRHREISSHQTVLIGKSLATDSIWGRRVEDSCFNIESYQCWSMSLLRGWSCTILCEKKISGQSSSETNKQHLNNIQDNSSTMIPGYEKINWLNGLSSVLLFRSLALQCVN